MLIHGCDSSLGVEPTHTIRCELYPKTGYDWPNVQPWRLVVEETPAPVPPDIDHDSGVITVGLPKAEVFEVRLNSLLLVGTLDLFGVWEWITEGKTTAISRPTVRTGV